MITVVLFPLFSIS